MPLVREAQWCVTRSLQESDLPQALSVHEDGVSETRCENILPVEAGTRRNVRRRKAAKQQCRAKVNFMRRLGPISQGAWLEAIRNSKGLRKPMINIGG